MKKILLMLIGTLFTVGLYAQVEGIRPTVVAGDLDISGSDTTGEMLWYNHTTGHWEITYGAYLKWSQSTRRLIFGATSGITLGSNNLTQKNINGIQWDGSISAGTGDTLFLGTQYLWSPNTNTIQGEGSIKTGTSDTLFSGVLSVAGNADVVSALTAGTVASDATVTATTSFNVGSQTISQGTVNRLDFNNSTSTADTAFLGDRTTYLKQDLLRMGNSGTITIGEQTLTRKNTNGVTWNNSITATDSIFAAMLKASGQMSTGTNAGTSGQINFTASDNDQLNLAISTSDALDLNGGDFTIDATQKIYLDGGSDTYDAETSADVRDTYVGGVNMIKVTEGTGIDAVRILNAPLVVDSSIRMSQLSAAPTKPIAGNTRIYADNTGNLDIQDPNGVVRGTGWTPPLKGMTFDGVDDLVTVADNDNLDFGTGDFSLRVIFSTDDVSGTEYLINKEAGGIGYGIYKVDNDIYIRLDDNTTDVSGIILTDKIVANTLYSLVITFDRDGSATAYLNGISQGTVVISTASLTISNTGAYTIGATTAGASFFDGNIYDDKTYNRLLTASEVLTHWNDGHPELYAVPYADKGASQTELVANGTFTGSSASWTEGAGWAYGTNNEAGTATSALLQQIISPTIGRQYKVSIDVVLSSGALKIQLGNTGIEYSLANGSNTLIITPTASGNIFIIGYAFTGTVDNISVVRAGCVADYQGEWANTYSWIDKSGNSLDGVTSGTPVLTIPLPEYQYGISQIFTTNIVASAKVLVIPANYQVESIYIQDMGTAGGLTGISATQETSGITLIAGKAVATGTGITFRTIADHNVYSTNKNLSFLATGNGSSGMRIVTTLKRVN